KLGLAIKQRWLDTSVAAVRELRRSGVPVIGYTWFPLFTMVDWRYRTGQRPLEEYFVELGLYERGSADGDRYVATPLVAQFREFTRNPAAAVGDLLVERVGV
ncbi:MAG TPA: hypothetical protein VGD58_25565, partial [Herpetosiphonaceae bacterium]